MGGDDERPVASASAASAGAELERAMADMSVACKDHAFWETQPVAQLKPELDNKKQGAEGPIDDPMTAGLSPTLPHSHSRVSERVAELPHPRASSRGCRAVHHDELLPARLPRPALRATPGVRLLLHRHGPYWLSSSELALHSRGGVRLVTCNHTGCHQAMPRPRPIRPLGRPSLGLPPLPRVRLITRNHTRVSSIN